MFRREILGVAISAVTLNGCGTLSNRENSFTSDLNFSVSYPDTAELSLQPASQVIESVFSEDPKLRSWMEEKQQFICFLIEHAPFGIVSPKSELKDAFLPYGTLQSNTQRETLPWTRELLVGRGQHFDRFAIIQKSNQQIRYAPIDSWEINSTGSFDEKSYHAVVMTQRPDRYRLIPFYNPQQELIGRYK